MRVSALGEAAGRWASPLGSAFRPLGRASSRAGRALRPLGRAWRRSLQLRVAATTVVISGVVLVGIGAVLLSQISSGTLSSKQRAAIAEADDGRSTALRQLQAQSDASPDAVRAALSLLVSNLASKGSSAGEFDVVILLTGNAPPVESGQADPSSIPASLRAAVNRSQVAYQYAPIAHQTDTGVRTGELPGLIVGEPVTSPIGTFGVYYLFSMQAEQATLALVQRTVLVAGAVLVVLLAAIAAIVTRQVVAPVRAAARTAERLAAGRLHERLPVRGEDDLARLATSFNEMAASLQRQITRLENLSLVQRRFTSDVSHELRTPLTTVRMAADLLYGARDAFEPAVARSAELLEAELERFETLLADLLEISRHDAGAADLDWEALDLGAVIHRVVDSAGALATSAGSSITVSEPDRPVIADVDSRRIQRILRNLLGNAVEHGEGRPITVTLAANDTAAAVLVRDRGVGLQPGDAERVFDRFWRADPSRARRTGGTGLGLAISAEDAHLHGGTLAAWGQPGAGAWFRLTVPLRAGTPIGRSPLRLPSAPPSDRDEAPAPPEVLSRPLAASTSGVDADHRGSADAGLARARAVESESTGPRSLQEGSRRS